MFTAIDTHAADVNFVVFVGPPFTVGVLNAAVQRVQQLILINVRTVAVAVAAHSRANSVDDVDGRSRNNVVT